ncbi:hypothetical protein B0H17DRAFT_1131376 [Mycena rosella]|uniref:Uncharacterized protein n=1 Tax=Mycena rosella TaxID=1033263 RepID=A0AAD7DR77_MYCRO|nr:hypothetical protein B0H17DRAFT_1131376 [Mycena rosella]
MNHDLTCIRENIADALRKSARFSEATHNCFVFSMKHRQRLHNLLVFSRMKPPFYVPEICGVENPFGRKWVRDRRGDEIPKYLFDGANGPRGKKANSTIISKSTKGTEGPVKHVKAKSPPHQPSSSSSLTRADNILTNSSEPEILPVFLECLFRYMATYDDSPAFGPSHIDLVSRGYGRFADSEMFSILVDEPMTLVGAARGLFPFAVRSRHYSPDDDDPPVTFLGTIARTPPRTTETLSYCITFYHAQILSQGHKLSEVFQFPHKVPAWAKQSAKLVKLARAGRRPPSSIPSFPGLRLPRIRRLLSPALPPPRKLFHGSGKLADKSFIWIALRALLSTEPVSEVELKTAISGLHPDPLFADEGDDPDGTFRSQATDSLRALPHRLSKLGDLSLLRMVSSFPAELDLEGMTTFKGTDDEVSQTAFFDNVRQSCNRTGFEAPARII